MSSLVGDLWPSDLVKLIPSSPMTVLKEQALRLGAKTGELVQGDVRPQLEMGRVTLSFDLVMPLLENYRYQLFKVIYPADQVYPLSILERPDQTLNIQDPDAFINEVRRILSSERIKNIISSFVDMQRPQPTELEISGWREPGIST